MVFTDRFKANLLKVLLENMHLDRVDNEPDHAAEFFLEAIELLTHLQYEIHDAVLFFKEEYTQFDTLERVGITTCRLEACRPRGEGQDRISLINGDENNKYGNPIPSTAKGTNRRGSLWTNKFSYLKEQVQSFIHYQAFPRG
jgi:hypothetical protein